MPPPIRLYIAVADGPDPGNWPPFSVPLQDIDAELQKFEAAPADANYPGATISYLLRPIGAIADDDTLGIIAVLIDGKDFADDETCPKVTACVAALRTLARLLSRQKEPYYRKYGFRLWLVTGTARLTRITQIGAVLREPLEARGIDPRFERIPHPVVLETIGKNAALEVAMAQVRAARPQD